MRPEGERGSLMTFLDGIHQPPAMAGWMPVTSAASAPPRSAPTSDPTARVAWASMVGTSLESFDFYVFAYFSAFFVGPLFFEPLGEFGATLAAFSTIALAFVVRP